MKASRFLGKFILRIVAIYLVLVLLLNVFAVVAPFSGIDLVVERFLTGFWHFLARNIPMISWNAATWVPGLAAFFLAVIVCHGFLRPWANHSGRPWSLATSFCLVSLVPVLFVIAFLVPGVLLQWDALRETAWIDIR